MNNAHVWINAGYELFAHEGHEGLQVERMARKLDLNKSGFYHYFGDRNFYLSQLMRHHHKCVDRMLLDVVNIDTFDPDYLHVIIKHPNTLMVNRQLAFNQHISLFNNTLSEVNQKIERSVLPLWADYVGMYDQPNLALGYFKLMHDALYSRLTFDCLNFDYLYKQTYEVKTMLQEMLRSEDLKKPNQNLANQVEYLI